MHVFEARRNLKVGAPVDASDGSFGHLRGMIVDLHERQVVALVVRHDTVPPREIAVPFAQVREATDRGVWLHSSRVDLEQLAHFDPKHPLPRQNAPGATATQVLVHQNHTVHCTDGRAGRLVQLQADPSGHLRHLLIHTGRIFGHDHSVPADWIGQIDDHTITLTVDRATIEALPTHRSDNVISADVDRALRNDDTIRDVDRRAINVEVDDGLVVLSGYVSAPASKANAERDAQRVTGVTGIENHILTDGETMLAVAQALGQNPRTHTQHISVAVDHGVVTLSGEVPSLEVREAAEACAAGVAQARGVINQIVAPGITADECAQRVVQPGIGMEVFAGGSMVGRVERVIVSAQNRCVSAMVVHGQFLDAEHPRSDIPFNPRPTLDRQIVVPVSAVVDVTPGGVFLDLDADTVAQLRPFNQGEFVAPDEKWQPPHPYGRAQVLLERRRAASHAAPSLLERSR